MTEHVTEHVTEPLVIISLQNQLPQGVGAWVPVITGVIFVVCVIAFRRGIVGALQALLRR